MKNPSKTAANSTTAPTICSTTVKPPKSHVSKQHYEVWKHAYYIYNKAQTTSPCRNKLRRYTFRGRDNQRDTNTLLSLRCTVRHMPGHRRASVWSTKILHQQQSRCCLHNSAHLLAAHTWPATKKMIRTIVLTKVRVPVCLDNCNQPSQCHTDTRHPDTCRDLNSCSRGCKYTFHSDTPPHR